LFFLCYYSLFALAAFIAVLAVVVTTFWAAVTLPSFADHLGEVSVYSIQALEFFSSICCCFCEVALSKVVAAAAMLLKTGRLINIAATATTLLRATSQQQHQLKEYK